MAELPRRAFVKICGVTNVQDARHVIDAGADALGLIFASSRRQVTLDQARKVVEATNGELLRFAVFREASDDDIIEMVEGLGVDVVQVHGALSDKLHRALRDQHLGIVKALSIHGEEFGTFNENLVDAVLIDGPEPGSGTEHSWAALASRSFEVPVIAAGGLTPQNVRDVIVKTHVWGVDVASGVEVDARTKDPALVTDFITRAKEAFAMSGEAGND